MIVCSSSQSPADYIGAWATDILSRLDVCLRGGFRMSF